MGLTDREQENRPPNEAEIRGLGVDEVRVALISVEIERAIDRLRERIYDEAAEYNAVAAWRESPARVAAEAFARLGIPDLGLFDGGGSP